MKPIDEIRKLYDEVYDNIHDNMELCIEELQRIEEFIDDIEDEEAYSIKDYIHFIERLKIDGLYTEELERFMDDYIKFHNE